MTRILGIYVILEDQNFAHNWLFHRQTSYRQASCRQTLLWKNIFADRHTDRFFAKRTSLLHTVVGLYLKCLYFWKVYVLWERIQVSLERKGCPIFLVVGSHINLWTYLKICRNLWQRRVIAPLLISFFHIRYLQKRQNSSYNFYSKHTPYQPPTFCFRSTNASD